MQWTPLTRLPLGPEQKKREGLRLSLFLWEVSFTQNKKEAAASYLTFACVSYFLFLLLLLLLLLAFLLLFQIDEFVICLMRLLRKKRQQEEVAAAMQTKKKIIRTRRGWGRGKESNVLPPSARLLYIL